MTLEMKTIAKTMPKMKRTPIMKMTLKMKNTPKIEGKSCVVSVKKKIETP